jgi:hypothetical protein
MGRYLGVPVLQWAWKANVSHQPNKSHESYEATDSAFRVVNPTQHFSIHANQIDALKTDVHKFPINLGETPKNWSQNKKKTKHVECETCLFY